MINRAIRITSVDDIKTLCNAAVEMPFDIDILSGNYILDAKSFMGIFSLDRSQPMSVRINASEEQAVPFLTKIKELCQ